MTLLLPADPRHGRRLPRGDRLAAALRRLFARAGADVRSRLAGRLPARPPDLSRWLPVMRELVTPLLAGYLAAGARSAAGRLVTRRRKSLGFGFDLLNPHILAAADELALVLCRETLDTCRLQTADALAEARRRLREGLAAGDTYRELSRSLRGVFDDPFRAARIATTEASRATHAGQVLAAAASGVVTGKRWLASADACELCMKLDGKEVGLDEPFAVIGTGTYARVLYPPAHPHCGCALQEVIG